MAWHDTRPGDEAVDPEIRSQQDRILAAITRRTAVNPDNTQDIAACFVERRKRDRARVIEWFSRVRNGWPNSLIESKKRKPSSRRRGRDAFPIGGIGPGFCRSLGLRPIDRLQVYFRVSDELRIARMVDRLDSGDDFSQCRIVQANVIDEFGFCICRSGNEDVTDGKFWHQTFCLMNRVSGRLDQQTARSARRPIRAIRAND